MGVTERKEREKKFREKSIVDAAEKIFFSRGLETATMDEVAAEAELSKGTVYLYFSSKEQLYHAIMVRAQQQLQTLFEKVFETPGTGVEKLKDIGRAFQQFFKKYPDYFKAMSHYQTVEYNPKSTDPVLEELHLCGQCNNNFVVQALLRGMEDGTIRKDINPIETAILLYATATGVLMNIQNKCAMLVEVEIDPDRMYETYLNLTTQSLKP